MDGHPPAGGGLDPSTLRLVVRANVWSFDVEQVADEVRRYEELGADEVIVDAQFSEAGASVGAYADAVAALADALRPSLVSS